MTAQLLCIIHLSLAKCITFSSFYAILNVRVQIRNISARIMPFQRKIKATRELERRRQRQLDATGQGSKIKTREGPSYSIKPPGPASRFELRVKLIHVQVTGDREHRFTEDDQFMPPHHVLGRHIVAQHPPHGLVVASSCNSKRHAIPYTLIN